MRRKKQIVIPENYLTLVPRHPDGLHWTKDEAGIVTLEVENKGLLKRITQVLFFRPKISYIHLDKFGSFVWLQINGERSITDIGELVEAGFGEEAHPLYERLATYFRILESYGFVVWEAVSENG